MVSLVHRLGNSDSDGPSTLQAPRELVRSAAARPSASLFFRSIRAPATDSACYFLCNILPLMYPLPSARGGRHEIRSAVVCGMGDLPAV